MAGGQACIFHVPAERQIEKRIGAAGNERPSASNQSLYDSKDETRQSNGPEEKREPNRDCGQYALRKGRQHGSRDRKNDEQERDGNEQPPGIAEIRDLVESRDKP